MSYQLLLLKDVYKLGRKGDIVRVKPGFARNFLLPQQQAVLADKRTLRLREKLQQERAKQAEQDRKEAEELSRIITGKVLETAVKVDHEGHMYGSVTGTDIVNVVHEQLGMQLEKNYVQLEKPIKKTGVHSIALRLKEGVQATFTLNVVSELEKAQAAKKATEEKKEEVPSQD